MINPHKRPENLKIKEIEKGSVMNTTDKANKTVNNDKKNLEKRKE